MPSPRPSIRIETSSSGNTSRGMKLLGILLVFLLATGVGLLVSNFVTLGQLLDYRDAESWPRQPVIVNFSRIQHPDTQDIGCALPHIEYVYEHNGAERSSIVWGFSVWNCASPAWAQEITERYPPGRHFAHVDPKSGRAVLDPDTSALWFIALGGPVCLALFFAILFLFNRTSRDG